MRIGFIGMGRMGMRMAPHLLAAGFDLTVYNRTVERCRPLAERGATVAASPAELAATSDVVITMVSDQEAAEAVLLGPAGALTTLRSGSAVIDMSTIGPTAARALARAASEYGVDFLDAPVSGSTAAAEAATLVTMVGGERAAFERVRPVLTAMTTHQHYLGPPGAGAAMKLAVNTVIAVTNEVVSEALVLAERSGIERAAAYAVLAGSAVASPYVAYKQGHFLNPSAHPVTFTPSQMQKDLDLALGLARDVGLPLFTAAAANQVLSAARGLGYGDMDMVRVADVLRSLSA
jgi:3-hydroxyisobutyrate dehydrogenase-like beta-hydroxyacid dehydrogenase